MRKVLLLLAFPLFSIAPSVHAQFCPGAAPWVFDDVPVGDLFCGYITWAAQNGITLGCAIIDANHRLYCPNDAVTRSQMAAFVNRLGNVRVEAVGTGPGLTGGPITGIGTINLAATNLLPTAACANNQIARWNGSAWACSTDANSGGTVTSVGSGTGLSGGPITTSGSLSIAAGYQLPQSCTNGQVPKSDGAGGWTCAADANSGGTVTSVATGSGLAGGPITTSGTINLAATQLLPTVACANGQVPTWTVSSWTCATPGSFTGNIVLPNSTASVGNIVKPGGSFLHNFGSNNTFAGVAAGNFTMTGAGNTAVGYTALASNSTGSSNAAVGTSALGANTTGDNNTAFGESALAQNTSGSNNSALGGFALWSNTTGSFNLAAGEGALPSNTTGSSNVGVGTGALLVNATGNGNTAVGTNALKQNQVDNNSAFGRQALGNNTTGLANVAMGAFSMQGNQVGAHNVAVGVNALGANLTGGGNVVIGDQALWLNAASNGNTALGANALASMTAGGSNVAIGAGAGVGLSSGDNNIYIVHQGTGGPESQTIRIGTANHLRTFVAGINGTLVGASGVPVLIDNLGQLGTVVSSARFKDDIADMGGASAALSLLRPVTFHYKSGPDRANRQLQYGLIAEEVAQVYPDLVARSADGRIETVKYQYLAPMLLNEYQKQQRTIQAQAERLAQVESDRLEQAAQIVELRRAVEVLLARTSPEGRIAAK